jgi:hypothetical protein
VMARPVNFECIARWSLSRGARQLAPRYMASPDESALAEPAGHITGVGGVFFKAKDPKALAAWYRDVTAPP